MVDFNGFDKGVIGKRLPADSTLNCMKKSELIKLLHLAEDNHRVLAEAYKIAVDTSKCNLCPLGLDKRRADEIRKDAIRKFAEWAYDHSVIAAGRTKEARISKYIEEYEKQMKEGVVR